VPYHLTISSSLLSNKLGIATDGVTNSGLPKNLDNKEGLYDGNASDFVTPSLAKIVTGKH